MNGHRTVFAPSSAIRNRILLSPEDISPLTVTNHNQPLQAQAHQKLKERMSRGSSSLPSQIPILPLFDQYVLFPGLLLRLRITDQTSIALLSHILHSDQTTLLNSVLGCVPT